MRTRVWTLAVLTLMAAACDGGGMTPGRSDAGDAPAATSSPAPRPNAARTVTCYNRNASFPDERVGYRYPAERNDLVAGPLIIPGVLGWATANPSDYGRDGQYKVGVVVRAGSTVTLSVPPDFHGKAGLMYGDAPQGVVGPRDAEHTITFTACRDFDTAFPGYLYVPEPGRITLRIEPAAAPATHRAVDFFTRR